MGSMVAGSFTAIVTTTSSSSKGFSPVTGVMLSSSPGEGEADAPGDTPGDADPPADTVA
jgi:hypothetical protein